MYFADPDAFCKDLHGPLNGKSDSRQADTAADEDVELVQVEIDEEDEVDCKENRDPVDNSVSHHTVTPLQRVCKNNGIPEVRNVTETDPERCEPTAPTIQIPSTVVVQSVDTIKTDHGVVRKITVVRVPGSQQTPRMVLVGPPKAAGPPVPPPPPPSSTDDVSTSTSTAFSAPVTKTSLTLQEKQKGKPPFTYVALISKALLSSPDGHMTINGIYNYIMENYPFYRTTSLSWRNAIRHNLCVNDCFIKAGKIGTSRLYQWGIHPDCVEAFRAGKYSAKPDLKRQNVKVVQENNGKDPLANRNTNWKTLVTSRTLFIHYIFYGTVNIQYAWFFVAIDCTYLFL